MIVWNGKVVSTHGDISRRYYCHSVRKSFMSALYGVHIANRNIDLNKTIKDLGIDDHSPLTDSEKEAKIIDLLKARSGIYHPAASEAQQMKAKRPKRKDKNFVFGCGDRKSIFVPIYPSNHRKKIKITTQKEVNDSSGAWGISA